MPAIVANLLLIIICMAVILIAVGIKLRCRHPPESRETIGISGNSWYWECRDCGKRKTKSLTR